MTVCFGVPKPQKLCGQIMGELCCVSGFIPSRARRFQTGMKKECIFVGSKYSEILRTGIVYYSFAKETSYHLFCSSFLLYIILNNLLNIKAVLPPYLKDVNPWCFNPVKNLISLFSWFGQLIWKSKSLQEKKSEKNQPFFTFCLKHVTMNDSWHFLLCDRFIIKSLFNYQYCALLY